MRHTNTIITLAFLFASATPVSAANLQDCTPRSQSKVESYGQISQHGFDRALFGKTLKLELNVSEDNLSMEIGVAERDLGLPAFILVGISKTELDLPWGDSLLVGDIAMVLELPTGAQFMNIDLSGIARQAGDELRFYFQAFALDTTGTFPMLTSQGIELTLSDAVDDACRVYLPLRAEQHDDDAVEIVKQPGIADEPDADSNVRKVGPIDDGSPDDGSAGDGSVSEPQIAGEDSGTS